MRTRLRNQRGTALLETAITLPIILFVSVAIFEFGRAYQVQQVLTNAAREGARIAVLEGVTDDDVRTRVRNYLSDGGLVAVDPVVERAVPFGTTTASRVTINFPFSFIVLNPVARLVVNNSSAGEAAITMRAQAMMRNE
jgi:Flp pilus assembly protein TadG